MNNEEMKKKIEELEKFSLRETRRLEERIRTLENDLDSMVEELQDSEKTRRAVLEIQEFLTRKSNGYDEDFYASFLLRK